MAEELTATTETQASHAETIENILTFFSDGLVFGVPTSNVLEIITDYLIRPLPMVPNYVSGIINLRGQIIPIIDFRQRMGKAPMDEDADKTLVCTIILQIDSTSIGIVVDSVQQVLDTNMDNISPIPVENRQELTDSMLPLGDGSVALLLNCQALIQY